MVMIWTRPSDHLAPYSTPYRVGSKEIVSLESFIEKEVSGDRGYEKQTSEREDHGKCLVREKLTTGANFIVIVKWVLDSNGNFQDDFTTCK